MENLQLKHAHGKHIRNTNPNALINVLEWLWRLPSPIPPVWFLVQEVQKQLSQLRFSDSSCWLRIVEGFTCRLPLEQYSQTSNNSGGSVVAPINVARLLCLRSVIWNNNASVAYFIKDIMTLNINFSALSLFRLTCSITRYVPNDFTLMSSYCIYSECPFGRAVGL